MLLAGGTRGFDRQIAAPSNPNFGRASIHQLKGRAWTCFFSPFLCFSGGGEVGANTTHLNTHTPALRALSPYSSKQYNTLLYVYNTKHEKATTTLPTLSTVEQAAYCFRLLLIGGKTKRKTRFLF